VQSADLGHALRAFDGAGGRPPAAHPEADGSGSRFGIRGLGFGIHSGFGTRGFAQQALNVWQCRIRLAHRERAGSRAARAHDRYAMNGMDAFRRMRGMFAVAIWDASRERLVLARDRAGKKPLYYMQKNGELLFASEPKAILAALTATPAVNAEALVSFLTFGF